MDVKDYMQRDFQLLQKRVEDVRKSYQHQDPAKTMTQATEMFDAFSRRFALEDFLFSKIRPTGEMQPVIEKFLKRRRKVRESLEDLLMLHVSEPDFMKGIKELLDDSQAHLDFLHSEFHPGVIDKLPEEEMQNMANALEDRLHSLPIH
jgi:hypothetical protein